MRGLADELAVSPGMIRHWFATKDHVLAAVLDELAVRFNSRLALVLAEAATPRDRLLALAEASVPETPEQVDQQRVWGELGARAARTRELAERHERHYDGWRLQAERAVEAGVADGGFHAVDAAEWARTYLALLDGLAMHVLLHPESVTPSQMRTALRAHIDATLMPQL